MTSTRRDALRALLPAAGVDALLVTDLVNVAYLSGFTGSNAALLVHADGADADRLCTDARYRARAEAEAPGLPLVIERASALALAAAAAESGVRLLGFESDQVTVDAHAALVDKAQPVALVRTPGLVQGLRAVKDETEIATLRAACGVADAALTALIADGGLAPGRTEEQVATDLENRMRERGARGPSFATILAAGPHSAVPHHSPTPTPLRRGDLVKLDFGALVDGYHSDMTRTVVLGPAADWQRELHSLVGAALAAGRAALRPGIDVADVDAAARSVIEDAGRGDEFVHGLGHGVGLQIHEAPLLAASASGPLAARMVVTVEPGVYLPGRGGVRIEDTLVVRSDAPEVLTGFPRDLLEL